MNIIQKLPFFYLSFIILFIPGVFYFSFPARCRSKLRLVLVTVPDLHFFIGIRVVKTGTAIRHITFTMVALEKFKSYKGEKQIALNEQYTKNTSFQYEQKVRKRAISGTTL